MPAYSLDLRIRVMAAYCQPGARQAAVAARFGVSVSFFKKLLRHERQTGSLVPKPASGGRARYLDAEVLAWGAPIPEFSQEVDMPRIAAMARQAQPGILLVDRTVHGPYENYQTPEQRVPAQPLPQPWESCLTLANNWGYVPGDTYKSPTRIIHTLVEVVAKGGSLLLGVGPRPDGTLADEATTRLATIGKWLAVNGPAIYSTRATARFQDGSTYFTQGKTAPATPLPARGPAMPRYSHLARQPAEEEQPPHAAPNRPSGTLDAHRRRGDCDAADRVGAADGRVPGTGVCLRGRVK